MDTVYISINLDGDIVGISFTEQPNTIPARVSDKSSFIEEYSLDTIRYDNGYLVPSLRKLAKEEVKLKRSSLFENFNSKISNVEIGANVFDLTSLSESDLFNRLDLMKNNDIEKVTLIDKNERFVEICSQEELLELIKKIVSIKESLKAELFEETRKIESVF